MIKSLSSSSNLYLNIDRVTNCFHSFKHLASTSTLINSNLQDPLHFFKKLHQHSKKHKKCKRTKRRDIEAVVVTILLPKKLNKDQLINFAKEYAVKGFQSLPYAAFKVSKGSGNYLVFLVSERRYLKKGIVIEVKARSNVYQKINEQGKKVITKSTDPDAFLVRSKGEVYSTYKSHFTNKNRLFTGNDSEFTHKVKNFKRMAITLLTRLNFVIKRAFFRKINIKKAKGNYLYYKNIRDINETFLYFENEINKIENHLLMGYMEEELKEFNKIKYRFLNRAREMRFQYGRVSLPFHYKLRRDRFRENLEAFVDTFDLDIKNFHNELANYLN